MTGAAKLVLLAASVCLLAACGGRSAGTLTMTMTNLSGEPVEQARVLYGQQVWQPGYVMAGAEAGSFDFRLLTGEPLRVEYRDGQGRLQSRSFESRALARHHGETEILIQRDGTMAAVSRYDLRQ